MAAVSGPLLAGEAYGDVGDVGRPLELAAIFGDNDLDDAVTGESGFGKPFPDNCVLYDSLGADTPSTGRIAKIDGSGSKTYLGTAETLIRDDIVISASHIVTASETARIRPDDELVFEVHEPADDKCRISTHRIIDYRVLTSTPSNPRCAHLDFALFRLEDRVAFYRPLKLASPDLVEDFRTGKTAATKFGFANHPSTDFGRAWSIVTTTARPLESRDPSCLNANLFAYEGDAWSGESGAAFRVDGEMVGMHLRGYDNEFSEFSKSRANIGALVSNEVRQRITAIMRELNGE